MATQKHTPGLCDCSLGQIGTLLNL